MPPTMPALKARIAPVPRNRHLYDWVPTEWANDANAHRLRLRSRTRRTPGKKRKMPHWLSLSPWKRKRKT